VRRLILALLLGLCTGLQAQVPVITKTFGLNEADLDEVKAAVESVLSTRGKVIVVRPHRKLIVQDEPEYLAAAQAVIEEYNKPQPNVRVEVTLAETGSSSRQDLGLRQRHNSIVISPLDRGSDSDSLASQFLMVRNGGEASISVGEEVPFADYFYSYALGLGYVEANVHWEQIGTRMSIKPLILGNTVQVEITPEVTTLVGGRQQVIKYRNLSTTVTVANGSSVQIGGFSKADETFNRNFFSRGRRSQSSIGTVTLKATIQAP
jgi:type II secretory pathway component GspD/PulD (secretin)